MTVMGILKNGAMVLNYLGGVKEMFALWINSRSRYNV